MCGRDGRCGVLRRHWLTGDPLGWCQTVIDPTADKLISGGDTELADALLAALHERLFGEGG